MSQLNRVVCGTCGLLRRTLHPLSCDWLVKQARGISALALTRTHAHRRKVGAFVTRGRSLRRSSQHWDKEKAIEAVLQEMEKLLNEDQVQRDPGIWISDVTKGDILL